MYAFDEISLFSDPTKGSVNSRWILGFPNKPWKGYEEAVEPRVEGGYKGDPESVALGFAPMLPRNGPKAYRVARIERDLAEVEAQLEEALVPRARFHATLSKHAYRNWLRQLRGGGNPARSPRRRATSTANGSRGCGRTLPTWAAIRTTRRPTRIAAAPRRPSSAASPRAFQGAGGKGRLLPQLRGQGK